MRVIGSSYSEGVARRSIWITLSLLSIAVLAPTLCVLWLVQKAANNERLAVLSLLDETRKNQVELGVERVDAIIGELMRRSRLLTENEDPERAFFKLIQAGVADTVVVRDEQGSLRYPMLASIGESRIGESKTDIEEVFAVMRRLLSEGKTESVAIRLRDALIQSGESVEYQLSDGRSALPMMAMMAIETVVEASGNPDELIAIFRDIVTDYSIHMPSSQRRFALRRFLVWEDDAFASKLLAAEALAMRWLAQSQQGPSDDELRELVAIPIQADHRIELLLKGASLENFINERLSASPLGNGGSRLVVLAPSSAALDGEELVAKEMSGLLAGWRVSLLSDSTGSQEIDSHVILYVWVGLLVIAISISLMAVVIALIRKQSSVAQLKNDLVATVSHELKTPIASIRLLVDTLLDDDKAEAGRTRDYLTLISKENKRLGSLIENFLSFSRMERNKNSFVLQPASVDEIVSETISAFRDRFSNQDFDLSVDVQRDIGAVNADAEALQTALGNLLENAFKYGGDDKLIALRARNGNGHVAFEIEDKGPGIAKKDQRRIFQRFYQGNRKLSGHAGGVGLGLSIVSFIVSKHRGRIELESEEGAGSIFRLIIPNA